MTEAFHPGQRWISHTESELGLGLVQSIEGRHVRVTFPASDETRVYALANAPLHRVHFPVGEQVRHQSGWSMSVTGHEALNGCTVYLGEDKSGSCIRMLEQELDSATQFNQPEERLFAGQIDSPGRFSLRVETLKHLRRQQQSPVYGLLGARVQLLPHQFYIAAQISARKHPRVLLADEVGLGKTIEAGLILHQQLITGQVSRVLVVVPESLQHQWLVEMLRRFNLRFSLLDQERCEDLAQSAAGNLFDGVQLAICSLEFLMQNEKYYSQATESKWDMLIVDEAHHLQWDEGQSSPAYDCIQHLAQTIPSLLLLTATPEQLGEASHFARLRMLDPDRFYDLSAFIEEQKGYIEISDLVGQLQAVDTIDAIEMGSSLDDALTQQIGANWRDECTQNLNEESQPRMAQPVDDLIDQLLDRHGTGRVLLRNTRDAIQGFPQRRWHDHPLSTPDCYLALDATEASIDTETLIDKVLHPEKLWETAWAENDPRVAWLLSWLEQHKQEKVLLICALAETAIDLDVYLTQKMAIRTAVFHEHLSLVARDRAAAYFAEEDKGAQLLVCSEIGSEGRNFQFAHHLILFDLPLNPDLLEQRIGRLDRIGQTETIHIHTPHYDSGAQQRLVRWYQEGIGAFEHVCPMGHTLFEEFGDALESQLLIDNPSKFETLLLNTQKRRLSLADQLQAGRDHLLEMNSCRPKKAADILDAIQESTRPLELSKYMEHWCDEYGVEQTYHSADAIVIRPTESMLAEGFSSLPEDGLTATYRRSLALQREDMTFLTWEHPLVLEAMDRVMSDGFGNVSFCTLKLPPLAAGLIIVEVLFDLNCPAPKTLQISRYLPASCGRVVVSSNGMDLTNILMEEHINSRAERVKKRVAQDVVQHARPMIQSLIDRCKSLAEPWFEDEITRAEQAMRADLQHERARLLALSKVNPMIRQEELDHLNAREKQSAEHLSRASLKLDSIRVMLTT